MTWSFIQISYIYDRHAKDKTKITTKLKSIPARYFNVFMIYDRAILIAFINFSVHLTTYFIKYFTTRINYIITFMFNGPLKK